MAKHQITKVALENLQKEHKHLLNIERPKIIKEIQEARDLGDLSENADYEAAKNQQSFIDGRISEISEILDNFELISEKAGATSVEVGTKVKILDMEINKEAEYEILGTIDNDPGNFKISNESPLAIAIMGKKVGDVIEIIGIQDPYQVKILGIS